MGTGRALWLAVPIVVCALLGGARAAEEQAATYAERQAAMLAVIQAHAGAGYSAALAPAISPAVIAAMGRVERHEFVPEALRARAYEDRPLPIGYGQTISQPYIVALMTDLLEPAAGDRVLEIGRRRQGARDRHRLRLSGGGPGRVGARGLLDRDRPGVG